MTTGIVDDLRLVPSFADLSDEQLAWLVAHGTAEAFEAGDIVFAPGAVADSMAAIMEGAIEIQFTIGGQRVPYFTQRSGAIVGLLPFSRLRNYPGSGHASGRTRLFRIHQSHFDEMLRVIPVLGPRLVSLMTDRVRDATRFTEQRERMMALGKLAAGLAHELNNPAAAVARAADLLCDRLAKLPEITARLVTHASDSPGELSAALAAARVPTQFADQGPSDPIARSAREESMGMWLDEREVPESWLMAETLVDAGLDPDQLEKASSSLRCETLADYLQWFEAILAAQRLASDIHDAAARITELVGSVKTYSHMDRAGDRQQIDLREGLDSTLVMLGHKIKRHGVVLERAYAEDLPPISAHPGELNQVWTNLIDNALDAMPTGGTLRVETARDGSMAAVRVSDSGGGIPLEIQSRIFEAFFTTKPVGEGTGLGLDIVQRIVAQQHGGRVDVESVPGRTVFTVRLPLLAG